jgi:hypothetical protein
VMKTEFLFFEKMHFVESDINDVYL